MQKPDAAQHDYINNFLEGVAPLGENMVMVLDLNKLMDAEELEIAA